MLKLMELSMAAGLTFTWDAHFGYMKYDRYDVHTKPGGGYEVYCKSNCLSMFATDSEDVVNWLIDPQF